MCSSDGMPFFTLLSASSQYSKCAAKHARHRLILA